ncbi:MAG: PsbP-like protein [Actinomycetota bacterium]|nr:PsbP-like protein [Actinomycetota bacterium]
MGDRPQDQAPADSPTPRPARARGAASSRPRPAGRAGGRPAAARAAARSSAAPATGSRPPTRPARGGRPAATASTADGGAQPPAGPAPSGRNRRQPSQNTMVVLLSVVTVAVISLVVYAFVLKPAENTASPGAGIQTSTTLDPAAPGTTLPDDSFATYTSSTQGFRIKYPQEWTVVPVQEGELDLDAGGSDAVSVRLLQQTEVPTNQENVANIKAFTDGLVGSNKSAKILKVQGITVDGMPGYYYLYTYTDPETGAEGAHAQYFLFRGRNMYTIVFQANPSEGFTRLSKVFDQMAESFETAPDTSAASGTTTTPTTVG